MTKKVGAKLIRRIIRHLFSGCFVTAQLGFKELMMGRIIFIWPAMTHAAGVRESLRWIVLNGREDWCEYLQMLYSALLFAECTIP